jgi:hemerythrin-like domain-containing protein/rubredoxin
MLPIGPLMAEHRLIERMIMLVEMESHRAIETKDADLLDTIVDFFRTYADRCHHGKEEHILFRDLDKKELSKEHRTMMNELAEEHVQARKIVGRLEDAKDAWAKGDGESLNEISGILNEIANFYPKHIMKEDRQFFFPCMEYFTEAEQEEMVLEFTEFDKNMIHEKYRKTVTEIEKARYRTLEKWRCRICSYTYSPELGDPSTGITPGTTFEKLPENWVCPVCHAPKTEFEKVL